MPQTALKAPLAEVEWSTSDRPVAYADAVARMDTWVDAIAKGQGPERMWLLEHPPIYTAGTSAKPGDLLDARFPVFKTGRGGEYTYHGPGQRVAYVMLDLKRRKPDVRVFVNNLEEWIIRALDRFGVNGERRKDRIGIWVARGSGREDKIAAIGVRVRHWVTFHGIALNANPDLSHFTGIVPCGVQANGKFGVTSLADLGVNTSMAEVDAALKAEFTEIFAPALTASA